MTDTITSLSDIQPAASIGILVIKFCF